MTSAIERPPDVGEAMVATLSARWAPPRRDRALIAQLRRAAGRPFGDDPEAARALFSALPSDAHIRDRELDDLHLVATLFAVHPPERGQAMPERRTLGATLSLIARDAASAAQRQIDSLLVADREDLGWHLRRSAALARSHDVAIDYGRLWRDVRGWSHPDRWVQRRWAADFYSTPSEQETSR